MKKFVVLLWACAGSAFAEEEKKGALQEQLDVLTAKVAESDTVLSNLKKLQVSGYVQGRYTYADPGAESGFSVARGRVKLEYLGEMSRARIQIDATPEGVVLKDAEAGFIEPWSGKQYVQVTLGQTKWPFGYEVDQSSSEREFPERSRAIKAFFNGTRDRGLKVQLSAGLFKAWAGVFDGNGTENLGYIGVDNDREKDVYGRVTVETKYLSAGVSGSTGKTLDASLGRHFDRNRIGADAQLAVDLLPIGSTGVKAEFVAGRSYQIDDVELYGQPGLGWYALVVQQLWAHDAVGFRYDFFDPAAGTPNTVEPSALNQIHTFGIVAVHTFNDVLKLSVSYEVVSDRRNVFTAQLQASF